MQNKGNPESVKPIPKRFKFGSWCRETQELFIQGWMVADDWMKEDRRRSHEQLDRKLTVSLLENKLYNDGMIGDTQKRLEILNYFRQKENDLKQAKEAEQHRPVLISDQIVSLINTGLALSLLFSGLGLGLLASGNLACWNHNSQACQHVHQISEKITDYFFKE